MLNNHLNKSATLIFSDQLFENHPAIEANRPVFLAEEFLFFRVQPFHAQRLVLLRAAMQAYAKFLKEQGFQVVYLDSLCLLKRGDLFVKLAQQNIQEIHLAEFEDDWLQQDLEQAAQASGWKLVFYPSPKFLCSQEELKAFFKHKKHFSMAQFYADQRKRLNLLMKEGSPVGGQYSFDKENRKRLPKGFYVPPLKPFPTTSEVKEAIGYVKKHFPDARGEANPFLFPIDFHQARQALHNFIEERLQFFGDYEDAIEHNESFLFHTVLSSSFNIGILTPQEFVQAVLSAHERLQIPLNSIEGLIRQVVGWREFMRACYLFKGREQRSSNYFQHQRPLPRGFWEGCTGIEPIDNTIRRVLRTGYCHHIERLMVLGNFLLLTETDPHQVYDWFMQHFVDAYDWVMVPNIYGMSQYASGGDITTKPYVSGSNYILKMSNYSKSDWQEIWDGLFWRFLAKHKTCFEKNPRTRVLLKLLEKNASSLQPKIDKAEKWLKSS